MSASDFRLWQRDCLEIMPTIEAGSVDAIITDPPYGLGFMGEEWDKGVPGVHFWQEMIRVLKPGGYLLSFSGTRTYHRMATAIEDGGFEIRDMIEWVYGSGFPKSLNIGKAVDKLQGNEREFVGYKKLNERDKKVYTPNTETSFVSDTKGANSKGLKGQEQTKGTSEFEGWGTALKPSHEPICMARKPLSEKTVAENVLKWGTGGINIDESRVKSEGGLQRPPRKGLGSVGGWAGYIGKDGEQGTPDGLGRFPANLIHDNSEEVRECFPETKSGGAQNGSKIKTTASIWHSGNKMEMDGAFYDSGNASRFFKSIIYQAKASKAGRGEGNNHPTVKPVALMEYLIRMVTKEGGTVLDPFMGSGTTGVACVNLNRNFIGIELDENYFEIAKDRIEKAGGLFNG